VSLVVSKTDGVFFRCDGCLQPITEQGLLFYRPLETDGPVETLQVHKGCTGTPLIKALLPRYTSMPLRKALEHVADTLAAEVG
jgi:hypothetical protein